MKITVDKIRGVSIRLPPSGSCLEIDVIIQDTQAANLLCDLWAQNGDEWLKQIIEQHEGYKLIAQPSGIK